SDVCSSELICNQPNIFIDVSCQSKSLSRSPEKHGGVFPFHTRCFVQFSKSNFICRFCATYKVYQTSAPNVNNYYEFLFWLFIFLFGAKFINISCFLFFSKKIFLKKKKYFNYYLL